MGGRYLAFRAFIITLKVLAALTLIFGIGELVVSAIFAIAAPRIVQSNPTMNDLSFNSFDLAFSVMPNAPTGFTELDESIASLRNFGRAELPVQEVAGVVGLLTLVATIFRVLFSALFAFLFWALADYLTRKVRLWEREDEARAAAVFMAHNGHYRYPAYPQPSRHIPPPPPAPYPTTRPLPPPPPRQPTPLEQYLERQKRG